MTTAEATVAALIAHGIDTIYALPGVHNDHLFDALFKAGDRIRTIHTRHEQGAAYMALGAALATGKPQAYAVVPGPGLLNSAAALLTAYGMNAPVLALIGQIARRRRSAAGSATCTRSATRPASSRAWSIIPPASASPREAPPLVAEAIRAMATGRPGPAVLRMRDRRVGPKRGRSRRSRRPRRPPNRRSTRTRSATPPSGSARRKRPLIVCGGGAQERLARSDRAVAHAAGAGAGAIGAAAACSTAAIRSA